MESGQELQLCKFGIHKDLKGPSYFLFLFFLHLFTLLCGKQAQIVCRSKKDEKPGNSHPAVLLLPYGEAVRIKPVQCEVGSLATSSLDQLNLRDSTHGRANTCRLSGTTLSLGWFIDECGWLHVAENLSSDSIPSLTSTLTPSSLLSMF